MLNVKRKASEEIPDSFQHIWLYEKKYSYFWRILQVYNIRRQKGWNITFLFSSSPYFIIPTCLLHINTKNVNIKLKNLNKMPKTKIQNLNKKMNKIHIRLTEANELYCSCMLMLSTEMWPFFLFDQLYLLKIPFNLSEILDRKQLLTSSVNPDSPQSDSQHSYTNAELLVDSRTQWWWCTV